VHWTAGYARVGIEVDSSAHQRLEKGGKALEAGLIYHIFVAGLRCAVQN
jgi:hypothetical protein